MAASAAAVDGPAAGYAARLLDLVQRRLRCSGSASVAVSAHAEVYGTPRVQQTFTGPSRYLGKEALLSPSDAVRLKVQ